MALLEVKNLKTYFDLGADVVKAVDGVSLYVDKGETVAILGRSGSGKTVLARSILRVLRPPGRIVEGEVLFGGLDLLRLPEKAMRQIQGARIAMVFQEPALAFDPVYTVGNHMIETMQQHQIASPAQAKEKAVQLLQKVNIPDAVDRLGCYPHQFSGGMLQRVMIALALSCDPELLIADEPTTNLDVTTQVQVLELLCRLTTELAMGLLLITHNFLIAARYAARVYVMYDGRVMEIGSPSVLWRDARHLYSKELLSHVVSQDLGQYRRTLSAEKSHRSPPRKLDGCAFSWRCPSAGCECLEAAPPLHRVDDSHYVACLKASEARVR